MVGPSVCTVPLRQGNAGPGARTRTNVAVHSRREGRLAVEIEGLYGGVGEELRVVVPDSGQGDQQVP